MGYVVRHNTRLAQVTPSNFAKVLTKERAEQTFRSNRQLPEVIPEGLYAGRRCFIIGGGESLRGFDFSKLDKDITIGINKAFAYYSEVKLTYSMDVDFYNAIVEERLPDGYYTPKEIKEKWLSYGGIRSFISPPNIKEFGKEVYLIRRLAEREIRTLAEGIFPGTNCATGALMLAATLGCNPIYLLGYDLKCKEKTHFHGGYEPRDIEVYNAKLDGYRVEIEEIAEVVISHGINVINLNPNSNLRCFDFRDVNILLKN